MLIDLLLRLPVEKNYKKKEQGFDEKFDLRCEIPLYPDKKINDNYAHSPHKETVNCQLYASSQYKDLENRIIVHTPACINYYFIT
jgi:hypothetical protein